MRLLGLMSCLADDRTSKRLLRRLAFGVSCLLFGCALVAATAPLASASTVSITTDGTWLAKSGGSGSTPLVPGAGWNTNPLFDTGTDGGWKTAEVSIVDCNGIQDCIWYDGMFSTTRWAFFRHTFDVSGPVSSAVLYGGVDDDADIWINGNLVIADHNGFATGYGPVDIAAYLVNGLNLIAVAAEDNVPVFGNQHTFHGEIDIDIDRVPEPTSLSLIALGLSGFGLLVSRRRQRL